MEWNVSRPRATAQWPEQIAEITDTPVSRRAAKNRRGLLVNGDEQPRSAQAVRRLAQAIRKRGINPEITAICGGPFFESTAKTGIPPRCLYANPPVALKGGIAVCRSTLRRLVLQGRKTESKRVQTLRPAGADCRHFRWPSLMPLAGRSAHAVGISCVRRMPGVMGHSLFSLNQRLIQRLLMKYAITPVANSLHTATSLGNQAIKPELIYPGAEPARFSVAPHATTDGYSRRCHGLRDCGAARGIQRLADGCSSGKTATRMTLTDWGQVSVVAREDRMKCRTVFSG